MKIIGINGSPSKDGNTAALIRSVFVPLEKAGHDCEIFQLGGECRARMFKLRLV